jgi:uncharacterized protein YhdP
MPKYISANASRCFLLKKNFRTIVLLCISIAFLVPYLLVSIFRDDLITRIAAKTNIHLKPEDISISWSRRGPAVQIKKLHAKGLGFSDLHITLRPLDSIMKRTLCLTLWSDEVSPVKLQEGQSALRESTHPLSLLAQVELGVVFGQILFEGRLQSTAQGAAVRVTVKGEDRFSAFEFKADWLNLTHEILRFIPEDVLNPSVQDWLEIKVKNSQFREGHIELKMKNEEIASFFLRTSLHSGQLQWDEEWPLVEELSGEIFISDQALVVLGDSAISNGVQLKNGHAIIRFDEPPRLELSLDLLGDSPSTVDYLKHSSLAPQLSSLFNSVHMESGELTAQILLDLDFDRPDQFKLQGYARLNDGSLRIAAVDGPLVSDAAGTFLFTEDAFAVETFAAKFDENSEIEGTLQAEFGGPRAKIDVDAKARLSHHSFQHIGGFNLSNWFRGESTFQLKGRYQGEGFRIHLASNLNGIEMHIPGLLKKDLSQQKKLHLDLEIFEGLKGRLSIDQPSDPYVSMSSLYIALDQPSESVSKLGISISDRRNGAAPISGQVTFQSANIDGQIRLNPDDQGYYTAEFAKLHLNELFAETSAQKSDEDGELRINPLDIPSLRFSCLDTVIDDRVLGALDFELINSDEKLEIKNLSIVSSNFAHHSDGGTWSEYKGNHRIALAGGIKFQDAGLSLAQLRITESLVGFSGSAQYSILWNGPLNFAAKVYPIHAAGTVDLENGRMQNEKGKLLRFSELVTLNLLEMGSSTTAIRKLSGSYELNGSAISIKETLAEMPAASVRILGEYDLYSQEIKIETSMKLKISRALTAAAMGLLNPAAGLGYLAIAEDSLWFNVDAATAMSFKVEGSLEEPRVGRGKYSPFSF